MPAFPSVTALLVALLPALVAPSAGATPPVLFAAHELRDAQGTPVQPRALNDAGTVVGRNNARQLQRAGDAVVAPRGGPLQVFAPLGENTSTALAIDRQGRTAGEGHDPATDRLRAWVRDGAGQVVDLFADEPLARASANGINSAGTVVGWQSADDPSPWQPYAWNAGQVTWLGSLGGTYGVAQAINDLGTIVGWSYDAQSTPKAFVWTAAAGMKELPGLTGADPLGANKALAISFNGVAAGSCADERGRTLACWWPGGTAFRLGGLPGGDGTGHAAAINGSGLAVGEAADRHGQARAVLFRLGRVINLNLVTQGLPPGTVLTEAVAVNEANEIAVQGYDEHGYRYFLLTPL